MSIRAYGAELLQQAASIARRVAREEGTRLRWATVTSTDPLLIRYDGETDPSVVPPQTVAAVSVGDRVRVAVYRRQATILGPAGGGLVWHDGDIFTSVEPGLTITGEAGVAGGRVALNIQVSGLSVSAGEQSTAIGTVRPELQPRIAVPIPGYRTNGALTAALTGSLDLSVRWASTAASNSLYFATTYPGRS